MFGDDLLRTMMAVHLAIPVDYRSDNSAKERERAWANALLALRPDLARDALAATARASFAAGKDHIVGLHELLHEDSLADFRERAVFDFLREFPAAAPGPLQQLLNCAVAMPQRRDELAKLAREACETLTDAEAERGDRWLAAGYLASSPDFQTEIEVRAAADPAIIWALRNMTGYERGEGAPLDLPITQLEFLAALSGSIFPEAALPHQGFWGDQNAWDAAQFVHWLINQLSSSPLPSAAEALARLAADGKLASYRDTILHAQAEQTARRRELEFRQPDWREASVALANGAPANVADLCALVASLLADIAVQIGSANTDIYKQFWNEDRYGRPQEEKPEESCRDVLVTLLRPRLLKFGAMAEPEGHMAADRRTDIAVSMPGMKVVIELKRDSHGEVWSAAETQLDRFYTRDPEAKGFGIYGVFWFGGNRKGKLKPAPDGVIPPTAAAMADALRDRLPEKTRARIDVIVLDVSGS
jgi:hypothetical protein